MFGIRLRFLRCRADLTQAELGERLNISAGAVGMYEQGRRMPSLSTIVLISEVFCVSCDYLLGAKNLKEDEAYLELMTILFAKLLNFEK